MTSNATNNNDIDQEDKSELINSNTSHENDSENEVICSICLENAKNRSKVNNCTHQFCFDCIYQWSKVSNTCPNCQTRFTFIHKLNESKEDSKNEEEGNTKKRRSPRLAAKYKEQQKNKIQKVNERDGVRIPYRDLRDQICSRGEPNIRTIDLQIWLNTMNPRILPFRLIEPRRGSSPDMPIEVPSDDEEDDENDEESILDERYRQFRFIMNNPMDDFSSDDESEISLDEPYSISNSLERHVHVLFSNIIHRFFGNED